MVARALHVLGVVLWIGGVAFITTVLLPAVRRMKSPHERVEFFEAVEGRFAWQARGTTLLVGATGFHLTAAWGLWHRHRWFLERARRRPSGATPATPPRDWPPPGR